MLGCQTTPTPEVTAEAYAQALRENRLSDAYALTASAHDSQSLTQQAFEQRYADPQLRTQRAEAIDQGLASNTVTASVGPLTLIRENGAWRVLETVDGAAARSVLESFLDAAEHGDFRRAYELLSAPLRARYTPKRLEQDFKAEPLAKERLARAREALSHPAVVKGDRVLFPIAGGRAVQLVLENGAYRVLAIE